MTGEGDRFFPYDLDKRYLPVWWPLGVREGRHGVTLTADGRFVATYGRFGLETPMANVAGGHLTEGYRWWTSVGTRLSLTDDGLTFGTNNRRGVCVHFVEPVRRVIGRNDHSALTVTVADCAGPVAALGEAEPR